MESSVFNVVRAVALVFWLVLSYLGVGFVSANTDSSDVSALNVMYTSMNSPSGLDSWKSSGGDPCGDAWIGISCSGSKVTEIDLSGLGLKGSLGYKLSALTSVTYFDLSRNNFQDSIPYQLPPNIQRMDLSDNNFNGNIPFSISQMTDLKKLDLSFNSLSGDLPQSFMNLTRLTILHLQNNKFTGSINALANLPLDDLNVENNKFTGWIPDELKNINNLQTGGNSWSSGPAPPPPPGVRSKHRARKTDEELSGLSGAAIAGLLFSALIVLSLIIALFARLKSSSPPLHFDEEEGYTPRKPLAPLISRQSSNNLRFESRRDIREQRSFKSSSSFQAKPSFSSSSLRLKTSSLDHHKSSSSKDLARRSGSNHVAPYSLADLRNATRNFSTDRSLGEGSIGCVYRAKYEDGQVLALKKMDASIFQGEQQTEFIQVVSQVSKLRHTNICELVGYCSEQGHHILVYDFFRNGSLHEFLHLSDDFSKPLTWNTRVKIALGTARAIEYLHEVCSPPCIHKNIKSSNILLDTELNPHLSDCGFAMFHERRRHKQVENGYNAPECSEAYGYSQKSDVYSFGVVMLELMTGQVPFDSRKPKYEQSLVRWASPQLHNRDALDRMADPGLHGLYPPRVLSQFADVIAQCVRTETEFRPPISQVVQSLVRLVEATNLYQSGEDLGASGRTNDSYSFDY